MRSATTSTPRPLVMLLCTLLLTGPACTTRRLATAEDWASCCTSADECLALLQNAQAQGPDSSNSWGGLPLESSCAADNLKRWRTQVVPRLVDLLSDPSPGVRAGATWSLAQLHGGAREAIPALLALHEREPRGPALAALVYLDEPRALPLVRRHLQEGASEPVLPCLDRTLAPLMVEVFEHPEAFEPALKRRLPSLCSLPPELVPRLQELLRRELAEPSLRRPSGAACQEPAPKTCQVVLDGCLPHAASLLRVLADDSREEAVPEFLAALARGDERLTPIALQALVERRRPEVVPHLLRQLSSPRLDCRQRALEDFLFMNEAPPAEATEALLGLLERGTPGERERAAYLLGMLRDERAIEPLRRALELPHSGVQKVAARALGTFREKAKAALPQLEELARRDGSQDVRWAAAVARYQLSGEWKAAATPRCPRLIPYLDGWALRRRTGRLPLRILWGMPPEPLRTSGPCAGPSRDSPSNILMPMGQACLVARPMGDFSGWIGVREQERVTELDDGNRYEHQPLRALDLHGTTVVLQGLCHMGVCSGHVDRITRTPEGTWVLEPFAPLPGNPVAYAFDARGDLVIATTSRGHQLDFAYLRPPPSAEGGESPMGQYVPPFELDCREHPDTNISYVVRITRDGQVLPVE